MRLRLSGTRSRGGHAYGDRFTADIECVESKRRLLLRFLLRAGALITQE